MNNLNLPIIIIYVSVIIIISFLSYSNKFKNIFGSSKKVAWWITGLSYFMITSENVNMLAKMGIVIEKGYSELWIFYSSVLAVGFIPVIFAPLWSRLKFITDNQFILLRFSGIGAQILHIFRATYVGYLACSIFISIYLIALIKLFSNYFSLSHSQAFIIVSIIVFLTLFKNSYAVKIKTDIFNSVLYLVAFVIGSLFVVNHFGGFTEIYSNLNTYHSESISLFSHGDGLNTPMNLIVYFGIQWWSISIIDGSGPRAQRFMSVKTKLDAFKTAVFPMLLMSILFVFKSFVLDTGLYVSHQSPELIPSLNGIKDYEGFFISIFNIATPPVINTLVFIAFFIGLISIFESLLNWGASFISVDIYSTYVNKTANEKDRIKVSYLAMALIATTGLGIAYFNTHMLGVQKFIFSMSAGVGPVFALRWFWKRINAWSQLSAMLSSLVFTVGVDFLFQHNIIFNNLIQNTMAELEISYYPLKLTLLTILVTMTWVAVTFLTKADNAEHLKNFNNQLQLNFKPASKVTLVWKSLFIFILPLISILPFLFVWCIKFYSCILGIGILGVWIALIFIVVLKMNKIYPSDDKVGLNSDS